MWYTISLDVHRRETQACIADDDGEVVAERRFRTSERSFRRAPKKHGEGDVVFETVGFYRPVARWLGRLGYDVHLAHVGRIPKCRQKTDKKDALRLLTLWRGDALPEAYLPPEEVQRLRDLARHRQLLGQESRRLKAKLKQDLYKHGPFVDGNPMETERGRIWLRTLDIPEIQSALRLWERLDEEIRASQERIDAVTTDLPEATLLMTVPGIGAYTALLILAEVGDFSRFPSGDRLAAYIGLVPSQHRSGGSDRKGSITKEGNPILRWALVEAARNPIRLYPDSSISLRYVRLAQAKGHAKAVTATARQLGTVLWTMMSRREPFQVNP